MVADPTLPEWDKNQTNLIFPIAGHKNDGWANAEVVPSSELNGWQNLVYQNINFLRARDANTMIRRLAAMLDPTDANAKDPEFPGQSSQTDCVYAFAVHGGSAYLKQGSANNKLKISAGMLFQLAGGVVRAYDFAGTDEVTIANGDATNPRVDLLQMKIDIGATTGLPAVTLSVKQGTAVASPTYPAPDAGYCAVAGIVVGATYSGAAGFVWGEDTAGAVAVVHDQRVPLGVKSYDVHPRDATYGTDWAPAGSNALVQKQNNNAGNALVFALRESSNVSRLLGVMQGFMDTNQQDVRLSRLIYGSEGGAGTTTVTFTNLAHAGMNGSGAQGYIRRFGGILGFQTGSNPMFGAGPTVLANANGMGPPIWTNGRRAANPWRANGNENFGTTGVSRHGLLCLCWIATGTADSGTQWGPATFYVCEGL